MTNIQHIFAGKVQREIDPTQGVIEFTDADGEKFTITFVDGHLSILQRPNSKPFQRRMVVVPIVSNHIEIRTVAS